MILCPKCGKVDRYIIKEYIYRTKVFDDKDKYVKVLPDVKMKQRKQSEPRCFLCHRLVKIFEDIE